MNEIEVLPLSILLGAVVDLVRVFDRETIRDFTINLFEGDESPYSHFNSIGIDRTLDDYDIVVEEIVYNAALSSGRFEILAISKELPIDGDVEDMVRTAVQLMPVLKEVFIHDISCIQNPESFYSILAPLDSLAEIMAGLGDCNEQACRHLSNFVQESTALECLSMVVERENTPPTDAVDNAVTIIFDGVSSSTSLKVLGLVASPSENVARSIIAPSIAKCSSLQVFAAEAEQIRRICKQLSQLDIVRNFGLFFNVIDDSEAIEFCRSNPWKPLLSQEIPLNFWPSILAKANQWTECSSHGPQDVVFFLLCEKNDVLLQNVRAPEAARKRKQSLWNMLGDGWRMIKRRRR